MKGLRRSKASILIFCGFFICAAVTQLAISWYHRRTAVKSTLARYADGIAHQLAFAQRWDLNRYRAAEFDANHFYIIDRGGTIIDVEGFVAELDLQVTVPFGDNGLVTVSVPETGETWRLFTRILRDSSRVILGISPPDELTRTDERLEENANRFGDSIDTATKVSTSEIDKNLDYALVDRGGHLRFALGGIPLKVVAGDLQRGTGFTTVRQDREAYAFLSTPFRDRTGQTVGFIWTLDALEPEPWLSVQFMVANLLSSALLAVVATVLTASYALDHFEPGRLFEQALRMGECDSVEFKAALRWDQPQLGEAQGSERRTGELKSVSEFAAIKTVAAFLNGRRGGTLLIGIADDRRVVGLEADYQSLVKPGQERGLRDKDRDRFQLHLRNLLSARVGRDISNRLVQVGILPVEDHDVCVIHTSPSPSPVYVSDGKSRALYIRVGSSTEALDVPEAVQYVQRRWPTGLWRHLRNFIGG